MNILYTNILTGYSGGHATYIQSLIAAFENDNNCFVACPASSSLYDTLLTSSFYSERLFDINFNIKLKSAYNIPKAIKKMLYIVNKYDIDIVHASGTFDNKIAILTRFFSKKKFKIIFTRHSSMPPNNFTTKYILQNITDAAIFVCEHTLKNFYLEGNFFVIRNGIDTTYWQRTLPVKTGQKITLVSNAGTAFYKGWEYLIEAVKLLNHQERARLNVCILGEYPCKEHIKHVLGDLLSENIVEFPGFIDDARMYLQQADIGFVLSHATETISFACREMMSMSLPVIVSNFAGLPENVDCGKNGWVVPVKDSLAVRDLIRNILQMTPEEINSFKLAAREKSIEDFDIKKMAEETLNVYKSCIENK